MKPQKTIGLSILFIYIIIEWVLNSMDYFISFFYRLSDPCCVDVNQNQIIMLLQLLYISKFHLTFPVPISDEEK